MNNLENPKEGPLTRALPFYFLEGDE